jgi:hypothetical protein
MSKTNIEDHFKLPISFNKEKMELTPNIITDLELCSTIDESAVSMYDIILSPSTCFGEKVLPMFSKYYTNDVDFLNDSQQLLKTYEPMDEYNVFTSRDFDEINQSWNEIKGETSFCEKYLYIDWEMGKFLNTNSSFLQIMSIYNVTSPLISFCLPIIVLIIPFFIIHAKGLNINITQYVEILKAIVEKHALGKLFSNFSEVSFSQQMYILFSALLYVFSIYQNVLVCLRFYRNINKIHTYLETIKKYVHRSIYSMDYYLTVSDSLKSYEDFNIEVKKHKLVLEDCKNKIDNLGTFTFSWKNLLNIGTTLQLFYEIYNNVQYNESFCFSFGFNGYLDNLNGLKKNISNETINYATFSTKHDKSLCKFENSFYPALMNEDHVKNTCDFKTNMIITGPNASGKTTILKTSLINVILSQQFGCGCYKSANLLPYKYIHCYLNIPDTSGRDSLFQAEARRCKTIIDNISENQEERHFCAFDELYSGTNPDDAVSSSLAFMNYLLKYNNVSSILTTHYVKVCKKLNKKKNIKNYCMKTIQKNDSFEYTYILESGISKIKGGHKVLKDMNYPVEIISNAQSQ